MKGLLAVLDDEVWAKQILTRSPLPSNPMYWSVWGGIPPSMGKPSGKAVVSSLTEIPEGELVIHMGIKKIRERVYAVGFVETGEGAKAGKASGGYHLPFIDAVNTALLDYRAGPQTSKGSGGRGTWETCPGSCPP